MRAKAYAIIMAGGQGERLWPLTAKHPKQFLPLLGDKTLLQETFERTRSIIPAQEIYIVTREDWVELVCAQLPEVPAENVIAEPLGRNTAPCIGLAAVVLQTLDPRGVMVVLPADHFVRDAAAFRRVLTVAMNAACKEAWLVTLGIPPDRPATGYGYIERGDSLDSIDALTVYRVARFTEKPDEVKARRFLQGGDHWWNSGIFVWRVDTILEAFACHLPEWYSGLIKLQPDIGTQRFGERAAKLYQAQPSISIDYGVMEKTERAVVIPADIGWSDIGDWTALAQLLGYDELRNTIHAKHFGVDTEDSIVYSDHKGKLIGTLGIRDLIIVDVGEALLVMHKDRAQEVQRIAEQWTARRRSR